MTVHIKCLECGSEYDQEVIAHHHMSLLVVASKCGVCEVCGGKDTDLTFSRIEVLG